MDDKLTTSATFD